MDERRSGRLAAKRTRLLVGAAIVAVLALSLTYLILPGRAPIPAASPQVSMATTSSNSCLPLGGKGLYVRLVGDNTGKPIQNATIKGTPGLTCVDGETTTAIIWEPPINSSGFASLGANYSNWYKLTIEYSGNTYQLRAEIHQNQTTYVTVSLPSGKTAITFR